MRGRSQWRRSASCFSCRNHGAEWASRVTIQGVLYRRPLLPSCSPGPRAIAAFLAYRWYVRQEGSECPGPSRGGRLRDPQVDEAITDAARELLEEHGIDATSMDAIARRAGVARATVYRRWPNKGALIAQLIRDFFPE